MIDLQKHRMGTHLPSSELFGFSAGEHFVTLGILCARNAVTPEKMGCRGLPGGGMRTVFVGGLDPRIKCASCVGLMTTWKNFMLNKSQTHTWMTFAPLLPKKMDFPEIFGLRVSLPNLVLNASEDISFTSPGMKQSGEIHQSVYEKANVPDRFRAYLPRGS